MAVEKVSWVWGVDSISATEKFVLLFLAFNANQAGKITISKTQLADRCDMSKRAVDYCIDRLWRQRLISIHTKKINRGDKSNTYEVHRPEGL